LDWSLPSAGDLAGAVAGAAGSKLPKAEDLVPALPAAASLAAPLQEAAGDALQEAAKTGKTDHIIPSLKNEFGKLVEEQKSEL